MLHGEHSVTISRPATEVFDHIADGRRNATWRGSVVDVELRSGEGGAGSVWHQEVHGPGRFRADADYRVTRCERPHLYAFEIIAGPSRGTGVYTLTEETAGVTTVGLVIDLRPHGVMRVLNGFVPRQMAIELDNLDRLRTVLAAT
ncbi:MAG: hypothetical protein NVS3B18_09670 [Candidatus Dormibacteria bacterium]